MRIRDFEPIEGRNPILPSRGTQGSAGYDIYPDFVWSKEPDGWKPVLDGEIKPGQVVRVETGLKAYMPENEYLGIEIRSSYGIKKRLRTLNVTPVIDSDYYNNPDNEGHIQVFLVNEGTEIVCLEKDKPFCQGIFKEYKITDSDSPRNGQRKGGFGHTDRREW